MFRDRLREARVMRNMTQLDLAAKVPILSPSTISNYEKGKSEPDMYRLSKLIEALDVDANFLLQDEIISFRRFNVEMDEICVDTEIPIYGLGFRHGEG